MGASRDGFASGYAALVNYFIDLRVIANLSPRDPTVTDEGVKC
jgi:hypothetical protein